MTAHSDLARLWTLWGSTDQWNFPQVDIASVRTVSRKDQQPRGLQSSGELVRAKYGWDFPAISVKCGGRRGGRLIRRFLVSMNEPPWNPPFCLVHTHQEDRPEGRSPRVARAAYGQQQQQWPPIPDRVKCRFPALACCSLLPRTAGSTAPPQAFTSQGLSAQASKPALAAAALNSTQLRHTPALMLAGDQHRKGPPLRVLISTKQGIWRPWRKSPRPGCAAVAPETPEVNSC